MERSSTVTAARRSEESPPDTANCPVKIMEVSAAVVALEPLDFLPQPLPPRLMANPETHKKYFECIKTPRIFFDYSSGQESLMVAFPNRHQCSDEFVVNLDYSSESFWQHGSIRKAWINI